MSNVLKGNYTYIGTLGIDGNFYPPTESIKGSHISTDPNDRIDVQKVIHQFTIPAELFAEGDEIVATSRLIYTALAAGTLVGVTAVITTQATGADRTVDVDLEKSTGAGAFATVLSAPIAITNTTPIRTATVGTFASSTYAAGDTFRLTVSVAGSADAQAEGLVVTLHVAEDPT